MKDFIMSRILELEGDLFKIQNDPFLKAKFNFILKTYEKNISIYNRMVRNKYFSKFAKAR